MFVRLDNGWRYGRRRSNMKRLHPLLLPWRKMPRKELITRYGDDRADRIGRKELTDADKRTDRSMIEAIPRALALIGFTAVKLPGQDTSG